MGPGSTGAPSALGVPLHAGLLLVAQRRRGARREARDRGRKVPNHHPIPELHGG